MGNRTQHTQYLQRTDVYEALHAGHPPSAYAGGAVNAISVILSSTKLVLQPNRQALIGCLNRYKL
jgi:hypothetical protein